MQQKILKQINLRHAVNQYHISGYHGSDKIPTATGLPLIGTTLSVIMAGSAPYLHKYIDKQHKRFGPIFRETLGSASGIFLSDVNDIRKAIASEGKYPTHIVPEAWLLFNKKFNRSRGMLFMKGEEWHYHRRKMNKILMAPNTHDWITQPCTEVARNFIDCWSDRLDTDRILTIENLELELYKWSIDVMLAILLGSNYVKYKPYLDEKTSKLPSVIRLIFETSSKFNVIPATFASKLNLKAWTDFENTVQSALHLTETLLDRLLEESQPSDSLLEKMRNSEITAKKIKEIVLDLILSAGDTTAYSMEWILWHVSKSHEIQLKLLDAIENHHKQASNESEPMYLKCLVKESLRLHPIAPFLTRYMPTDVTIRGYSIPKDSLIVMSLYTMSRNETYFENPEEFWPERWYRTEQNDRQLRAALNIAHIPFAFGIRACVGRKIAETQIYKLLEKIIGNFELENLNDTEIEMVLRLVSVPSKPVKIRIKKR